jgi:hypothetical protein
VARHEGPVNGQAGYTGNGEAHIDERLAATPQASALVGPATRLAVDRGPGAVGGKIFGPFLGRREGIG